MSKEFGFWDKLGLIGATLMCGAILAGIVLIIQSLSISTVCGEALERCENECKKILITGTE